MGWPTRAQHISSCTPAWHEARNTFLQNGKFHLARECCSPHGARLGLHSRHAGHENKTGIEMGQSRSGGKKSVSNFVIGF